MENRAAPEIIEYLKDALHFLDVGGILAKENGIIGWIRRIFTTYLLIITPVVQTLGVYQQPKENLVTEIAFLTSTMWAPLYTLILLLQWYKTKDILILEMSHVREKQLVIGEVDEEVQKEIAKEIRIKRIASLGLYYSMGAIVFTGVAGWFISLNIATGRTEFNDDVAAKIPLTYPMWFPFDFKKSKMVYIFCSMISSIVYLLIGIDLIGTLSIFYAFCTFGTVNFMMLNNFIRTIQKRTLDNTKIVNRKEFDRKVEEELHKCIFYLEEILRYCELMESCYSWTLLLQTAFSSTSVAGSTVILILKSPANDGRYGCYIFLAVSCIMQTYIFCHMGNRLTEEAENIRESLYFDMWIDRNSKHKKTMLIMMTRMSKPVTITMGKFVPLGLNTFIQIMKVAYSFMTLFRNRNLAS